MATREEYANWLINNADKRGTPEFEVVSEAYKAASPTAPAKPTLPPGTHPAEDNVIVRGMRGAVLERAYPAVETMLRGASALPGKAGEWGEREVKMLQEQQKTLAARQAASRARVGDDGIDVPRVVGTAVADTAALGPMFRGARTAVELAKASGKAGALAGFFSPVEDSEKKSNTEFALDAGKNAAVTGGISAVAGPLISAGVSKLGDLGNTLRDVGRAAKGVLAPSIAQRAARDPRQVEAFLNGQAQAVGVDWRQVPEAVRESLREAARRAMQTTGQLPEAAVRNRLLAEAENLPQLTLGQVTRDPLQFTREANNPNGELRNLFGAQQQAASQRLLDLPNQVGTPPQTPYELGEAIKAAVVKQAETKKDEVGKLYKAFRDSRGALQPLENTQEVVGNAITELKQNMLWRQLPDEFRELLERVYGSNGQEMLNIRQAIDLRQAINSNLTKNGPQTPKDAALLLLKSKLDEGLANPVVRSEAGTDAIAGFRAANQARADLGKWESSSKAIKDLISREPQIANEYIFNRYVLKGSVKDMTNLWKTLPPEVQTQAKRAFIEHVSQLAMNRTGTQATGSASTAAKFLRQFPKEKLDEMFKPEELKSLRNVLEYLRLVNEPPAGAFKNTSNSMVDLKDFLGNSANIGLPIIGPQITQGLGKLRADHELASALRGGVHVPMVREPSAAVQGVARRAPAGLSPLAAAAATGTLTENEE